MVWWHKRTVLSKEPIGAKLPRVVPVARVMVEGPQVEEHLQDERTNDVILGTWLLNAAWRRNKLLRRGFQNKMVYVAYNISPISLTSVDGVHIPALEIGPLLVSRLIVAKNISLPPPPPPKKSATWGGCPVRPPPSLRHKGAS